MHAFKGSGKVMFCLFDAAGVLTDKWYPFGNTTTVEVTPESETIEVLSTGRDDYGQALDSMVDPKPTKGTLTINRFNHRNLAIAFMGLAALKTISEATITDEEVVAVLGGAVRLANGSASAVTVQDETDTTTYTVDTDYTIRTSPGVTFIEFPETSTIPDGATLHIDYTAGADAGYLIQGGTTPSQKMAIVFDGKERFSGKDALLDIFQCTIKPSAGFNFQSSDPAEVSYEIILIKLPTKSSSYEVHWQD